MPEPFILWVRNKMANCVHHWILDSDCRGKCCKCGVVYGNTSLKLQEDKVRLRKVKRIRNLIKTLEFGSYFNLHDKLHWKILLKLAEYLYWSIIPNIVYRLVVMRLI